MIAATNDDKLLRRRDGIEECAALRQRDDMVIVAVHDETGTALPRRLINSAHGKR